ncbi:MAG: hypothetical protein HY301_04835 [Verrucomicrobia bacterium]|nr:hypothetical protein [Verrucomicrobiota bacterium]
MSAASSNAASKVEEAFFYGTFTRPLDDKRRVLIPSEWREMVTDRLAVVVWPQHDAGICLRAFPVTGMKDLMTTVNSWPDDAEHKRAMLRFIGANSTIVELDKVGRICIPEYMVEKAGLKDTAVLAAALGKFEIWTPKLHAAAVTADHAHVMRGMKLVS